MRRTRGEEPQDGPIQMRLWQEARLYGVTLLMKELTQRPMGTRLGAYT
jgi:hypothetical protein